MNDLEVFGLHDQAEQARQRMASGAPPCEVYACNAEIFGLWAEAWGCWRWVGGGMGPPVRQGLDWVQVRALMGYEPARAEWECIKDGLRAMQDEALAAMYG